MRVHDLRRQHRELDRDQQPEKRYFQRHSLASPDLAFRNGRRRLQASVRHRLAAKLMSSFNEL
jgi:hypothetical protein